MALSLYLSIKIEDYNSSCLFMSNSICKGVQDHRYVDIIILTVMRLLHRSCT